MSILGQFEKPEAEQYIAKRKAYMVKVIDHIPQAANEYQRLCNLYWEAVREQLATLESKAGVIKHIFCEGIPQKGEDAKVTLQQVNPGAYGLIHSYVEAGVKISQFEDAETLYEAIDWGKCLGSGLISRSVVETIQKKYQEVEKRRGEFQHKALSNSVKDGEAALVLFSTPTTNIPESMQRFVVSPPELDHLERWIKQKQQEYLEAAQRQVASNQQEKESKDGGADSSTLWTPN